MADFAGQVISFDSRLPEPTDRIATLQNGFVDLDFHLSDSFGFLAGASSGDVADGSAAEDRDGFVQEMFGGDLFERIIVIPRAKALGFVLSGTEFAVEVWNTFHDLAKDLESIVSGGPGGITIINPFTLPKTIGPKGSIIFQAQVPAAGDTNINMEIVFGFSGISGTEIKITGARILVFSVAPNWDAGVSETISYLTDVLVSHNDTEQRRGLRSRPRRPLKFSALALDAQDAAGMESLIWGWQHRPYGVPFWQDAQPLEADIDAGDSLIRVNTVDRLFAVGGLALIWESEFVFEALSIEAVTDDSIAVSSPTQFAWRSGYGSKIVPLFLGRLSNSVDVMRLASFMDSVEVEFSGEAMALAPEPAISLTQFKGFDVLDVAPNWDKEQKRNYARSTVTMDPDIGPITVKDKGGSPLVSHTLNWWIDSHADITKFRAFILKRYGQLVPFWTPTWDVDLVLQANANAGVSVLTIKLMDYTRFFFPSRARRFLALLPTGPGTARYVEVTAAVDNGDGTESLTLAAPLVDDVTIDGTMISFLTFCRLGSDDAEIVWSNTEFAECNLPIKEIPRELPA